MSFRSALSRQIFEAVRIRRRGADVLNSKGEYNRSQIHRLRIDKGKKMESWGNIALRSQRGIMVKYYWRGNAA